MARLKKVYIDLFALNNGMCKFAAHSFFVSGFNRNSSWSNNLELVLF